jgi:hypothetical protein
MADGPSTGDPSVCPRCGASCRYPSYLRRHLARKTPCAPILEEADVSEEALKDPDLAKKQCRFCRRIFSSYTSMRRHVRTSCRIAPNEKNGDAGMELLYEHTVRKQAAQIAALEAQMQSLMKQLAPSGARAPSTAVQAGEVGVVATDQAEVVVDNSKKVVNINVFGAESLGHITPELIRGILDEALAAGALAKGTPELAAAAGATVLRTALAVYSDPGRPENLTCYLPNKKTGDTMVHMKEGWEVKPAKLVLAPMAQKSIDVLFDWQPREGAEAYGLLMREVADSEARIGAGSELRPVLVRNKALLGSLGEMPRGRA